jgi:hypothetical protein
MTSVNVMLLVVLVKIGRYNLTISIYDAKKARDNFTLAILWCQANTGAEYNENQVKVLGVIGIHKPIKFR